MSTLTRILVVLPKAPIADHTTALNMPLATRARTWAWMLPNLELLKKPDDAAVRGVDERSDALGIDSTLHSSSMVRGFPVPSH